MTPTSTVKDAATTSVPVPVGPQERDNTKALDDFFKTPLFMQTLPTNEEMESNDTMQALQSLIYDGPVEEVALNFKNQGNECFASGRSQYKTALTYYSKGLEQKCDDNDLNATLHANRAAVNLELGNYGKVLMDCSAALHLNPKHAKAFYRCIRALELLRRYDEALQCCELAHSSLPDNQTFIAQAKAIATKIKDRDEVAMKMKLEQEKLKQEDDTLKAVIAARKYNVVTEKAVRTNADDDSAVTDSEDESDENKVKIFAQNQAIYSQHGSHTIKYDKENDELSFPVVFIYPEFSQTDLIDAFQESSRFADHLEVMFSQRAPWDRDGSYTPDALEIFTQVRIDDGKALKLIRVGKQMSLSDVLKQEQFYVSNGICYFFVMPEKSSFTKMFKKKFKLRKIVIS